ncbi:unnamed protein product [Malassezia sympodialis ATCC 42132]|uniref:uncharacterized protein n=1 Tax=Malassezia sympodialis (strain ATCC 42132) TaxID=1230383 RepID=UPI0002C2BF96|nr:uncharacterized protein MSY001_1955 [Malassezia sympodialis ATCC 42132]CCU99249.1 unnamed protein product [Malassezia sympodialis ATCC 42132]|eukprot:XP_018740510.1 uncharacterized protein MSY001_1955 [Malassezia sympodialis ATCC 42132]
MVPLTGPKSQWLDQVLFLGTGTSSQVPAIHCITGDETECVTCHDALKPGSKNRRFCTSLVAVGSHPDTPESKSTILIDCGKSFYESALRYFPRYGLRRIDAVLLTHGHADAILGLDDLRSWTMGGCIQGHVDVYLTYECMKTVQQTFPYLIDRSRATGGGDVGALRWHLIDSHRPFFVGPMQVEVTPLPVDHGFYSGGNQPFECLGFRIDSMSYISDCAIDCLLELALRQSKCDALPPSLALLTDITHRVEHERTEAELQRMLQGMRAWLHEQPEASARWWDAIELYVADCTNVGDIHRLQTRIAEEFGGIDTLYLVFGALWTQSLLGIAGTDPTADRHATGPTREGLQTVSDSVRAINDANITGTALVLSALLPRLQTNSKAPYVCIVGSLASLVPAPTRSMYCATKSAQQMLVQSVAAECASQAKINGYAHVHFVVLAPSTVQTSFRSHMALTQGPLTTAPSQAISCVEQGITGVVPMPSKYFWVWLLSPLLYVDGYLT